MEFEWDPWKAFINRRKHGVSFESARELFADDRSVSVADPDHSYEEQRFVIFGRTLTGLHLAVSFTERRSRFRIISARLMTPRERRAYEA